MDRKRCGSSSRTARPMDIWQTWIDARNRSATSRSSMSTMDWSSFSTEVNIRCMSLNLAYQNLLIYVGYMTRGFKVIGCSRRICVIRHSITMSITLVIADFSRVAV